MLPVVIFVVVAIPVLLIGFAAVKARTRAAEHPAGEDAAARAEIEAEFEAAERYQEQWRGEQHRD
ncbi:MAG TPA: hypothetical protein VF094_06215 [Gaiellaceae bacterium]